VTSSRLEGWVRYPIVEVFADGEARARALEGCIAWLSYSPILMLGVFIAGLFW